MNFLASCCGFKSSRADDSTPHSDENTSAKEGSFISSSTSTTSIPTHEKHAKLPSSQRTSPSLARAAATPSSNSTSAASAAAPVPKHAPSCTHKPLRFWYLAKNRPAENDEEEIIAKTQQSHRQCCHPEKWTKERHGFEWSELGEEDRRKFVAAYEGFMTVVARGRGCT